MSLRGLLTVAVVGFAVVVGGKALYRERDRLTSGWRDLTEGKKLTEYAEDLSAARLLGLAGPLKDLVGQFSRLK